jgi:hypothetical protein
MDTLRCEGFDGKNMTDKDVYNWFIRPIKRYFTIDMPQRVTLLRAMIYPQSAKKLLYIVKKYMGIPKPALQNTEYAIEELSKIRLTYKQDFVY